MPDTLDSARLDQLDAFLLELNRASADVILPLFRADHGLEDKAAPGVAFDPVTQADKGAEAAIRKRLSERFPEHGVIGEEYGEDRPDAEFVWVLDPIDGTRAFIAGLPLWTTLIGLRFQGRPVLGSIGQPFIGEVFVGSDRGSRLISAAGTRPLAVRACPSLEQAVIATTDPVLFRDDAQAQAWGQLRAAVRLARYGCDAYAYAMVAMGKLDLVVETGLKAWDIEAAVPVLAGAGGFVADWRGAPIGTQGGKMLLAGDRAAMEQAAEILSPAA
ncbi:histidinol-phosphatase [Phenylobacterium montanum]|uniref:Histidinol-phosphatase n=1 Tax=Phenylobacterium montanum TaxID=2823693 RepID=A0A975FW53_9CAUL|nr:histidinol-phosphatase [Caulobacter sp. S6]QUD86395.1 histidinol-phosphatase [Caulobacter sp. S6]